MRNRVKAYLCRAASAILGIGTPFAVIAASPNLYFYKAEASLSAIAILAIIVSCWAFKDSIMKFAKTPSALKAWGALFIIALLGQYFFKQLIVLSAFSTAAQAVCIPLNRLDVKYTKLADLEKEEKLKRELGHVNEKV